MGVCGGFQMLGKKILDSRGAESIFSAHNGFGFFDFTTEFLEEKILSQKKITVAQTIFGERISAPADVYEIHMGRAQEPSADHFMIHPSGRILGTYYHGLFDSGEFRGAFLRALAVSRGKEWKDKASLSAAELKEAQYQRLADLMTSHLDLSCLKTTLGVSPREKLFT